MHVLKTVAELVRYRDEVLARGEVIHLVPTMGYFHEGHLSLMRAARAPGARVVVSLYVNPRQFGPGEDFARYPRDLARDLSLAEGERVDALFVPGDEEMYPPGFATRVEVEGLSHKLCGRTRPGHFAGVATVVTRLFLLARPARAYFGQKDFQQTVIVRRLVEDLALPVVVEVCPTVREEDGLAMSSRNVYLTPEERRVAPGIYRALVRVQERARAGERRAGALAAQLREELAALPGARVEYAELVDPRTLDPVEELQGPAVAAVAVWLGRARLIDNVWVTP